MKRLYQELVRTHIEHYRQMLFLAGPRQVGKTTISLDAKQLTDQFIYLNWDNLEQQRQIQAGPSTLIESLNLDALQHRSPIIVFDEIHKYRVWKNFLKGFYDTLQQKAKVIVTGSSRLDVYRRSGDSLMGRYFPYRIHPFSVAEIVNPNLPDAEELIRQPKAIEDEQFENLWQFGGFPEPLVAAEQSFYQRWKRLRNEQLFREDIRDLTNIQEIAQLQLVADLLKHQVGQLVNRSNLAKKAQVTVKTIQRWMEVLEQFYYCFSVKPWSKNVTRSLIKEPKIFLWDWSDIEDKGARAENFVAAQLLKAIHFWQDTGRGDFDLYFLRDKDKKEVDFLVTKEKKPWFLVEVKTSMQETLNQNLQYFKQQIKAEHAFQVVIEADYIDKDCFVENEPIKVPAKTFLSQLV